MFNPPKLYSPGQLANYMKLVRQKNQWTQNELARRIGIKQSTISNFENNPDKTTVSTLFKLLQALEMEMMLFEKNRAMACEENQQQDTDW
ncbi:type II toxin-antitoxin system antitoxin HipB [Erwinia sp. Eh17-17]|jgi:HTH-type transcriptional regulator/antitoxin HipB|uniref:type II toxin-antitoxin system antitoxin HipB n=1 Tax=Erwinia sp. Eh17-17 TaxID=3080330 RepID=UPI003208BE62